MDDVLKITYIGGPTVVFDFGGVRLITDPTFDAPGGEYTTGPVTLHKVAGPAIAAENIGKIDYVLLSHDHHFDNLDRSGRQLLGKATAVLTTVDGAKRLQANSVGLNPWDSKDFEIANGRTLRVIATPARHGPVGGDRGPVIGFVVHFTDTPQNCVYISGDSVWYEGMQEVAGRFAVSVAVLHLGAARVLIVGAHHITMTAEEAVEVARALSDATIVPVHFEGWQHFSEGKSEILEAFRRANLEQRLVWPIAGQPTEIPPGRQL
jgi:L-ascorbate metabolism protein UlaG (beta-lactamase superfamily)